MTKIIFYISIIITIISCSKEKNSDVVEPTATYAYVRTQNDSSSVSNNYRRYYEYTNNLISYDSAYQIVNGFYTVYVYPKVGNIINRNYKDGTPTYRYTLDANGVIATSNYIYPSFNLLKTFNYDEQKRLITSRDSGIVAITLDTLTWEGLNMVKRKSVILYNSGDKRILEYTYNFDLSKKNNLLNQYLGYAYFGYNDAFTSDNVCTSSVRVDYVYTAGNPIPAVSTYNTSYNHTFDDRNRIIQRITQRDGGIIFKSTFTYY